MHPLESGSGQLLKPSRGHYDLSEQNCTSEATRPQRLRPPLSGHWLWRRFQCLLATQGAFPRFFLRGHLLTALLSSHEPSSPRSSSAEKFKSLADSHKGVTCKLFSSTFFLKCLHFQRDGWDRTMPLPRKNEARCGIKDNEPREGRHF